MDIEISKAAFDEIVGKVSINRFIAKRNKSVGIEMDGITLWREPREQSRPSYEMLEAGWTSKTWREHQENSVTVPIEQHGIPFMVEDAGPEYRYED